MPERIKQNWKNAATEVGTSIVGSIGLLILISFVISLDDNTKTAWGVFASYFDGGELGLSILSLSGVIYILLMKYREGHEDQSRKKDKEGQGFWSYILFFAPVILAAFIVGNNPGFDPSKIGSGKLMFLSVLYVLVHLVWLYLLLTKPILSSPEEIGTREDKNVDDILKKVAKHGK